MISYFIKRLFLFIPSLLVVSLLIFYLSSLSSGNPALNKLESLKESGAGDKTEEIIRLRKKLGLQQPLFYFSIFRSTSSDTLDYIPNKTIQLALSNLAYNAGSWEFAHHYYRLIKNRQQLSNGNESNALLNQLLAAETPTEIFEIVENSDASLSEIKEHLQQHQSNQSSWGNYSLSFRWHGIENQYHQWMVAALSGNFGYSYADRRAVKIKVTEALSNTILLSFIALLLSFIIAVPLAIKAAKKPNSKFDRIISNLLFSFYALPSFWVATLLIVLFAGGEYLNIFPTYGLGQVQPSDSFLNLLLIRIHHLILPIACLTYGTIAFIFTQLKSALIEVLNSDYIKTASAKGLSESSVLWNHAFKNASFPLITIVGNAFPLLVSGSFVIEYIFSIPGIGKLTVDSFLARDYPTIFAILLLTSFMTLVGTWVADLFYHLSDPRLSLKATTHE